MPDMGTLDLILAAFLGIGVWRGLRTGALLQLVGTVGWVLAFVVGTALMTPIGLAISASLGTSERTAPVIGFIVTFGAVVAGLTAIAHVTRKTLEAIKLGGVDKLGGAVVGGVRAAFGLSVVLLAGAVAPIPGGGPVLIGEDTREASLLYGPIEAIAPELWDVVRTITPGMQEAIVDKFNAWQEGGPEEGEAPLE